MQSSSLDGTVQSSLSISLSLYLFIYLSLSLSLSLSLCLFLSFSLSLSIVLSLRISSSPSSLNQLTTFNWLFNVNVVHLPSAPKNNPCASLIFKSSCISVPSCFHSYRFQVSDPILFFSFFVILAYSIPSTELRNQDLTKQEISNRNTVNYRVESDKHQIVL